MVAVSCGYVVGELCEGLEGVGFTGGLRARSGTGDVHGVAAEGVRVLASLQGTRGGVSVSRRLRGDRRGSEASGASWGAVVVMIGVGVHA